MAPSQVRKTKKESLIMLDVPLYGEIGAGRVVPFIPQSELVPVLVPEYLKDCGICTLKVCGVSLENEGVYSGDLLICRERFTWRHITPDTVCAVLITATGELVAKKVIRGSNMLILRASGGGIRDRQCSPDDIEIKAIAIGFQRLWKR
jgi:SOS-response transcriptional repressor LexA